MEEKWFPPLPLGKNLRAKRRLLRVRKRRRGGRASAKPPLPLSQYESSTGPAYEFGLILSRLGDTRGFIVEIPESSERPLFPKVGTKTFWLYQLQAGLRFPIPPYLVRLVELYEIPLNQLNPASFRRALLFFMAATLDGVKDPATLFHRSHELKHRGHHLYFSPIGWFHRFYGHYESLDRE